MALEVVAFGFGALLVLTAVLGGGFEIREIRMPQVGAVTRVSSLVVGSVFMLLGLGIWEADRPHLVGPQPDVRQSLVSEQNGAPAQPQPAEVSVKEAAAVQPQPAVQQVVEQTYAPAPFAGITGQAVLSWTIYGSPYRAAVQANGATGFIRVAYDDGSGYVQEVDQDLYLQQTGDGTWYYQGANPRYAGTQTPHPDYVPDAFRLAQVQTNVWALTEICDAQSCAPIVTESAGP